MSWRCDPCDRNLWPYETTAGACPACGGGTRRVREPADGGPLTLRSALTNARLEDLYRLPDYQRPAA